jgi:hypothetical protein
MFSYCPGYQNVFARFLDNFFIHTPEELWMRWLCRIIPSSKGIINCTNVSDAVLQDAWKQAQQGLATAGFPLSLNSAALTPADPRALTIQPKNLTVVGVPDMPIADLVKIDPAWAKDKDPSGTIVFVGSGGLLDYVTCHGFTCPWARPRVYGANSVLAAVCVYEFQNVILNMLSYDVSNR